MGRAEIINVAKIVQLTNPDTVAAILDEFISQAIKQDEYYKGYENESKVFILMRVVFVIPEVAPADNSSSYKDWSNWAEPDVNGISTKTKNWRT